MAEQEEEPLVKPEEEANNADADKNKEYEPKDAREANKEDEEKEVEKDEANDDDKDKNEEEEEKKEFEVRDNLLPDDYEPRQRPSLAQTVEIPDYPKDARRLSKLEMKTMQDQMAKMEAAIIEDPKAAARKYSTKITEEKEAMFADDDTQKNLQIATSKPKTGRFAPDFHTKQEPDKLTFWGVCSGCTPLIFVIALAIFGLIVYGISGGDDDTSTTAGAYGDWPNWGGNVMNQQRAAVESMVNSTNVWSLRKQCVYDSNSTNAGSMAGASGYIVTDDGSSNGYFTDQSGYVTSINLDDCSENWRVSISEALDMDKGSLVSRNGLSLFIDSSGNKGVLLGSPSPMSGTMSENCYILALYQDSGDVMFSISTPANGSPYCSTDGFLVDGKYAYGGIKAPSTCNYASNGEDCEYRGEFIKINLDTREIVNVWYSLPEITPTMKNDIDFYLGAAPQNIPAIIDDYLIVGTGSLYQNPERINEWYDVCNIFSIVLIREISVFAMIYSLKQTVDPAVPAANADATNPCGEVLSKDQEGDEDVLAWVCYESDVYSDSVILFSKDSFEYITSRALQGNDVSSDSCNIWTGFDASVCPETASTDTIGPNNDVMASATYERNDESFVAVLTKSGMFYSFRLPGLTVAIAKKMGPAGNYGGGLYSLAVDHDSYIAMISITGLGDYQWTLQDGSVICGTGFVEAISLETGEILWQFVNPYGRDITMVDGVPTVSSSCANDGAPDYTDYSITKGGDACNVGLPSIVDAESNVVIPDVSSARSPANQYERATFIAPVTIANDLVFIPSNTGDVFIVNIDDGSFVDRLQCKDEYDGTMYNRPGISAGVTVVQDRVIMYCGSGLYDLPYSSGSEVRSYKLR